MYGCIATNVACPPGAVPGRTRGGAVSRSFTLRYTPAAPRRHTWLVLVGSECRELWVESTCFPDESAVRRQYRIPAGTEVLIGRP